MLRVIAALLALALTGCDDGPGPDADGDVEPDADAPDAGDADADDELDADFELPRCDTPIPFPPLRAATIPLDGQMLLPVGLDGDPGPFNAVIDTGAVRTMFDETLIAHVENGVGVVSIDFGDGLVLRDYEVLAGDLSEAIDHIGVRLDGLIGLDLFQQLYFGLDYAGSRAAVGAGLPSEPPPGFGAADAVDLPFDVVQGLPVVDASIGGDAARLIADTGSGVTIVTASFVGPDVLTRGIAGYVWYTSYGSDPGTIVRLPSIELGGHVVEDTWAIVVPDDHHLRDVFEMIGVDVDGFIGFPVYRHFFISVVACESRYELFPYADLSHVPAGEWDRVGLELMRRDGVTLVDMVFQPSDAFAQGVEPGDALEAIDGDAVGDAPLDELRLRLRGTPGDTRALSLRRDGAPLELTVAVDRLLPP